VGSATDYPAGTEMAAKELETPEAKVVSHGNRRKI